MPLIITLSGQSGTPCLRFRYNLCIYKSFTYLKNYVRGVNDFQRICGLFVNYLKAYKTILARLHVEFLERKFKGIRLETNKNIKIDNLVEKVV